MSDRERPDIGSQRVRSYRDLKVWIKAMDFVGLVYAVARQMPKEEQYRMTSQMLRSAASVPANIAEGYQRATRKDYANFISIARGSLAETETFLLLASRVGLLPPQAADPALALADELSRMLNVLRQKLTPRPSTLPADHGLTTDESGPMSLV